MLSFVTPWLFGAAVAASLVVAGLHLLSVRTPPPLMLPTARFVNDGQARAVARQPRLNDVRLLVLRVLALLLVGAALAGVRWQRTSASQLQLVVADDGLRADSTWRDSVLRSLTRDDALVDIAFTRGMARDAGASLVTAITRATTMAHDVPSLDRVALTVVLPSASASTAGFEAWRSQWPGRVQLVTYGGPVVRRHSGAAAVQVVGAARDDIVAAAFTRTVPGATREVRISRGSASLLDSGNVSAVRVAWPVNGAPRGWETTATPDTVGALVARGDVLVGPFVRTARLVLDTAVGGAARARPQVIAWWSDGQAAAVETARTDGGCDRSVAVSLPLGTDLLLADAARGVREIVTAPCGAALVVTSEWVAAQNAAARADSLAPASAFRTGTATAATSDPWWLTPALLVLAAVLLLSEWWWRQREVTA